MSARLTKLPAQFAEQEQFELRPQYERAELHKQFAALQENLLTEELNETATLGLHGRLKQAANEAAGLAWNSGFPLLVFPALFAEMVRKERVREERQQRIRARSEILMEEAVCA